LKRIKQVGAKWGDDRGLFGDKAEYAGYDDSGAWICRNHMCDGFEDQNKDCGCYEGTFAIRSQRSRKDVQELSLPSDRNERIGYAPLIYEDQPP
jgi:hypothetical protein